jgi:hypothetical protein
VFVLRIGMRKYEYGGYAGGQALQQPSFVCGKCSDGSGSNQVARAQASDGRYALRAVSDGVAEGLAEGCGAGKQQDKISSWRNGWLVVGGGFQQPAFGSIGLNEYGANMGQMMQIGNPLWGQAAQLAFWG